MGKIACPRCMPPGDPQCPYCDGQYNVTEIVDVSGLNEIQSLRVVAEAYQNRADAAEKRCHKLVVERDSAYQEIGRLRASLNCIAWPTAWVNIPEHQLTIEYLRHVAQDALAIGVPAARRRADDLIRDAELRHQSLSERHWTCMKCGGSWNCDRAESALERGNHAPVCGCPYCERDALRAVVERLKQTADKKYVLPLDTVWANISGFDDPVGCEVGARGDSAWYGEGDDDVRGPYPIWINVAYCYSTRNAALAAKGATS